jgi:exodeoxyribonuclease X
VDQERSAQRAVKNRRSLVLLTIDLESTGLDHKTDAVVEFAAVPVTLVGSGLSVHWAVRAGSSSLVAPGRRIPPEARAVHHLCDEDLRTAPQLPQALAQVLTAVDQKGELTEALCAHNAAFDRGFIGQYFPSNLPWLCTMRCAQHLWPDAPSYSNQVLRYWLGLKVDAARDTNGDAYPPHRALYDATVTAHLLQRMLETNTLAELLELQDKPVLQKTCRFGKHRGLAWSDVPRDYLKWVIAQSNPPFEDDVVFTCKHWLGY